MKLTYLKLGVPPQVLEQLLTLADLAISRGSHRSRNSYISGLLESSLNTISSVGGSDYRHLPKTTGHLATPHIIHPGITITPRSRYWDCLSHPDITQMGGDGKTLAISHVLGVFYSYETKSLASRRKYLVHGIDKHLGHNLHVHPDGTFAAVYQDELGGEFVNLHKGGS